nr:response regulator transcription factor [Brevundimonas lenta]
MLIVEDNLHLARLIAERLTVHGFSCDQAHDLQTARECLGAASYDLIILDLGLPDGDGLNWIQTQRSRNLLPPILILTARNALEDRVAGLDAGADDYLVKPFEIDELLARLRALMRRPGLRDQPVIEVGPLRFEAASRAGSYGGVPLDLSRRESDLLELLMRHAGTLVTRRTIEDALYNMDDTVTPNAVEAVVSRVRRKIEGAGGQSILHTVRGIGYLIRSQPQL